MGVLTSLLDQIDHNERKEQTTKPPSTQEQERFYHDTRGHSNANPVIDDLQVEILRQDQHTAAEMSPQLAQELSNSNVQHFQAKCCSSSVSIGTKSKRPPEA
jgi:hypothetical protein